MFTYLLYLMAALYLGLLTSISPCPLATNIAAISYIGRRVENPRAVLQAGLLYTLGRCLLYVILAVSIVALALSFRSVSLFLQHYMHLILGPVFLVLGMLLLGMIVVRSGNTFFSARLQQRLEKLGVWGALLLGVLFALSFCPTSAVWFFGLLALIFGAEAETAVAQLAKIGIVLPAASLPAGQLLMPLVYGLGTALPVLLVAFLLAYSVQAVGKTYNILASLERWARTITGWIFVLLGVWFSLRVFEAF
jgi:cytochrome c biogenesis protein CcdA